MQLPRTSARLRTGLAFEIADLVMLRGWAEFHSMRLAIELEVCAENEEYEELLALYEQNCAFRRWMLWRSCDGIIVQPANGRTKLFDTMADVVDTLIPSRD